MARQPNIALATIRSLADGRSLQAHPAGGKIFAEGDPGDDLYAIIEGSVNVDWGKGIYETLEPGDCFGFDVMIDPARRRYCTATAATAVQLLPMNREQFLLAIQEFPMFALESLQVLDDRLRHLKVDCPSD
jgi:CRP-like cAMP-binding protein